MKSSRTFIALYAAAVSGVFHAAVGGLLLAVVFAGFLFALDRWCGATTTRRSS